MMSGSRGVYVEGGIDNFPNIFPIHQSLLNNIGGVISIHSVSIH